MNGNAKNANANVNVIANANAKNDNKNTNHKHRPQTSRVLRLTAWTTVLYLVAQWIVSLDLKYYYYYHDYDPHDSLSTTTIETATTIRTAGETLPLGSNWTTMDEQEFQEHLWPRLQQKLCPAGTPKLSLGPTLFRLARAELEQDGAKKYSHAKSNHKKQQHNGNQKQNQKRGRKSNHQHSSKLVKTFFDNAHGSALVVDGNDPSTSLLYVRIWKCANNQIRDYLKAHFNQIPSKQERLERLRQAAKKQKGATHAKKHPKAFGSTTSRNHRHLSFSSKESATNSVRSKTNAESTSGANYTYLELEGPDFLNFFSRKTHRPTTSAATGNNNKNNKKSFFRYRNMTHDKPCVFTVIRDPIDHFLSGYNEIEHRILSGVVKIKQQTTKKSLLPAYLGIPHDGGGLFDRKKDPNLLRQVRFESFVRDLVQEHALFYSHWVYSHVFPMARVLHPLKRLGLLPTHSAQPQTNWILPSVKNLKETLPPFLAERCPNFAANYNDKNNHSNNNKNNNTGHLPPLEISGTHKSTHDAYGTYKAAKDVWKKGGRVARSLCHLHAFDYACFYGDAVPSGTPLRAKDVPRICQQVYASDLFQNTIFE